MVGASVTHDCRCARPITARTRDPNPHPHPHPDPNQVRKADNGSHFEGDCWPGRSAWVTLTLMNPTLTLTLAATLTLTLTPDP